MVQVGIDPTPQGGSSSPLDRQPLPPIVASKAPEIDVEKQIPTEAMKADDDGIMCSVIASIHQSSALRKGIYKWILLICFLDILGPLVLSVGEAGLVGKDAFPGQSFTSTPFPEFAMNKAVVGSMTQLGSTVSAMLLVPLSDKIGRKPMMMLFLYGGGGIFGLLMYAGDVKNTGSSAYYLYCMCKLLLGVLGGTKTLATVCIQDIFLDPQEKVAKSQATMPLNILGAAVGAMLGLILFTVTGKLMAGGWFAMGLSFVGGLIITFKVPFWLPPKDAKSAAQSATGAGGAENTDRTVELVAFDFASAPKALPSDIYKRILIAATFDNIGTAGLVAGLTLVLYTRFPYFVTHPSEAAMTSFGLIVFIFVGLAAAIPSLNKRGAGKMRYFSRPVSPPCLYLLRHFPAVHVLYCCVHVLTPDSRHHAARAAAVGFNAVFGNAATGIAQVVLVFCGHPVVYLCVLYLGISASYFSTVAYMPMLIEITPPEMRGKVMGT